MKPAPFAYDAPRELDELLALLARENEDVKVLAGARASCRSSTSGSHDRIGWST